jgi:hypothetical protein
MYELERTRFEERIGEFAERYEQQFGITFGERPKVVIASPDEYRQYLESLEKAAGIDMGPPEALAEQAEMMYMQAAGMYDDIHHQVLISDYVVKGDGGMRRIEPGMLDYVLAHELVHAYQHNHGSPTTVDLAKEGQRRFGDDQGDGVDVAKQLASALWSFPIMAIAEGQAEYMSTRMLKAHARDSPEDAAAFRAAAEKYQENYAGAREQYKDVISYFLEVEERMEQGYVYYDDLYLIPQMKAAQYVLGIGYIEDMVDTRGVTMDQLLDSGPKTLGDFLRM